MIYKTLLTTFWTIVFFLGTAFFIRLCFGILIVVLANNDLNKIDNVFIAIISPLLMLVPLAFGLVGVLLGMRGKLPGMKLKQKDL